MYLAYKNTGINSEKGLEYVNKAIEIDPSDPKAYYEKIRLLVGLRRYSQAEADLEVFKVSFDNHLSYYYWRMGWIKLRQNMLEDSKVYFEKGIENTDTNGKSFLPFYYAGEGYTYIKTGNFEDALNSFNQSLKYASYINESSYSSRGFYKPKERARYDEEFVRGYSHAGMSIAYQELGLNQKAEEEFEIAKSISPGSLSFFYENGG